MTARDREPHPKATLRIRNKHRSSLILVLEPRASEYGLLPGEIIDVFEEGASTLLALELHSEEGRLTVFGRSGGTIRVEKEGKDLP